MPVACSRLSVLTVAAGLAVFACACGGGTSTTISGDVDTTPQVWGAVPVVWESRLPGFPSLADDAPVRTGSAAQSIPLDGSDAFDQSAGATVNGMMMDIVAAAGMLEYATYQFPTGEVPLTIDLDVSVNLDQEYWLAFADYATSTWQLVGPLAANQSLTFAELGGNYLSGGGNVYLTVLTFSDNQVTVNSATVNYDDGVTPSADYLNDVKAVFDAKCISCHGVNNQFAGVQVHAFWAVRESQNLLVAQVVSGSHGSLDAAEKDTVQSFVDGGGQYGAVVSYSTDIYTGGGTGITEMRCSPCHISSSSGGTNWTTYSGALAKGDLALVRILNESMPASGGPLTDDQKDIWQAWVDQGKPE